MITFQVDDKQLLNAYTTLVSNDTSMDAVIGKNVGYS